MAAPKRTPLQIQRQRNEMARLWLRGLSEAEIGRQLEVSQQQVSYDLRSVRREWEAQAGRDRERLLAQELARIDDLSAELWAAWARSMRPRESTTTSDERLLSSVVGDAESGDGKLGGRGRTRRGERVRTENRDGNPAFLVGVLRCIERRCALLGLDAPPRIDIELEIREEARRLGLDEEQAVSEALQIVKEARGDARR